MDINHSLFRLNRQHKILRQLNILYFCLAVLALVLCFIHTTFAIAVLGITLVIRLFFGRKLGKDYVAGIIRLRAETTLRQRLENVQYKSGLSLDEQALRQVRMLPCNAASGSMLCREKVSGSYRGYPIALGDVTLTHTFTEGTKKRHNFLIGCWITGDLDRDTGLDCRFIGDTLLPAQSLKEMLWVEPDLKQSGKPLLLKSGWHLVCDAEDPAMPSDAVLKQLEPLHQKTKGQIAVCVQRDKLHVFLQGELLGRNVQKNLPPAPQIEQAQLLTALPQVLTLLDLLAG